jgi:Cytotoxic
MDFFSPDSAEAPELTKQEPAEEEHETVSGDRHFTEAEVTAIRAMLESNTAELEAKLIPFVGAEKAKAVAMELLRSASFDANGNMQGIVLDDDLASAPDDAPGIHLTAASAVGAGALAGARACMSNPACSGIVVGIATKMGLDLQKWYEDAKIFSTPIHKDDIVAQENTEQKNNNKKNQESESKKETSGSTQLEPQDPDEDPDDKEKERKFNVKKSESPVWKKLKPYRGQTKTNGLSGKRQRFYEWDSTHDDIEVYGPKGKVHHGSMDPVTGEIYKPSVKGRKIQW